MKTLLLLVILLSGLCRASVLSSLAAALPAHTWVKLPDNSSLNGLSMNYSMLYYTDSGVWDPVKKQVAWVGGPGTCCANPAVYKRIVYDEAANTWTIASTPFSGSGHGYDGNALDPKTGTHYFSWWNKTNVWRWNGFTWGMLPPLPFSVDCCNAISWFPDINGGNGGLVFTGANNKVAWFNGTSWSTVTGGVTTPWGGIELFSEYNPVHKLVWMGSGSYGASGSDRVSYTLDAQLRLTKKKDAPFNLKANQALKVCDPVSGKFIVYNMSGQAWWEYDVMADSWTQITNMNAKPSLGSESLFQVPIPEYGVILVFKHSNSTRNIYLYRHTAGTASQTARPGLPGSPTLSAAPSPVCASARISAGNLGNAREIHLGVYGINGRLIEDLTASPAELAAGITWQAKARPSGVYVLKLRADGRTYTKRLVKAR